MLTLIALWVFVRAIWNSRNDIKVLNWRVDSLFRASFLLRMEYMTWASVFSRGYLLPWQEDALEILKHARKEMEEELAQRRKGLNSPVELWREFRYIREVIIQEYGTCS